MMCRPSLFLFLLCISFYTVIQYGGIRAPDAEVVFRVGENLADGNGFGVTADLESWKGFGVARGKDSVLYSVYPPGESIALVPFILSARLINKTAWYENVHLPLSHYVNDGFRKMYYKTTETQLEPHALRFLCSLFNVLTATLGVLIFYLILIAMTQSEAASLFISLLYAFGTLIWSYSGTFFSEPLTLVFILSSFYLLARSDPQFTGNNKSVKQTNFLLSGVLMGLGLITHTNSSVIAPFFIFYAWQSSHKHLKPILLWLAGYLVFAALLGYFNWFRFGSVFETGRGLSAQNPVDWVPATSSLFWRNLYGILIGYGKGLLLFCPAVIFGFLMWRPFHRKHRSVSRIFLTMILSVVIVISSYQYWHGGFSHGPRYLLMVIPFMLMPSALWVKDRIKINNNRLKMGLFAGILGVSVIQQLYFCVGELFYFYHIMKWTYINKGVDLFLNDRFYLDWRFSPLHQLLAFERGPYLLRNLPVSNQVLWLCLSLIMVTVLILLLFYTVKTLPSENKTSRK